jgi:hypothetical protein
VLTKVRHYRQFCPSVAKSGHVLSAVSAAVACGQKKRLDAKKYYRPVPIALLLS